MTAGFHGEPNWSPDGTKIAFDSDQGDHPTGEGIYTISSSDGGALARVTGRPGGTAANTNPPTAAAAGHQGQRRRVPLGRRRDRRAAGFGVALVLSGGFVLSGQRDLVLRHPPQHKERKR
jgi:hypothetical protein